MAISDATGSISHNNKNIADIIEKSSKEIEGITGSAGNGFFGGGLFGGGGENFAGMDSENLETFNAAVDKYRQGTEEIIEIFNPDAAMDMALKGEVAEAVRGFLIAVKGLLTKYVQAIYIEKKEINEANANWLAAAGQISGDVSGDSDSIRSQANGISID